MKKPKINLDKEKLQQFFLLHIEKILLEIIIGLMLLNLIFWLAYRQLRPQIPEFIWRFQILLFKYPAFVALVAVACGTPRVGRVTAAALIIYACACAYEALHDEKTQPGAAMPHELHHD